MMARAATAHDNLYPVRVGGEWSRVANLLDVENRYQARQEHSSVELNGFV